MKGDDEPSVRALLSNAAIRFLLKEHTKLYLHSTAKGLDFVQDRIILNVDFLEAVHELFSETLLELQRLRVGSPPGRTSIV